MEKIPENLLYVILSRVSDYVCVLRCSLVCKQWLSIVSEPHFRRDLCAQTPILPYNICFQSPRNHSFNFTNTPHYGNSLSFLPISEPKIETSCRDLMVVSGVINGEQGCALLVNAMTRQWRVIPHCPYSRATRWALTIRDNNNDSSFKIVRFLLPHKTPGTGFQPRHELHLAILSSEGDSNTWRRCTVQYPLSTECPGVINHTPAGSVVALDCDGGKLCWLDGDYNLISYLAVYDPFDTNTFHYTTFYPLPIELKGRCVRFATNAQATLVAFRGKTLNVACLDVAKSTVGPRSLVVWEFLGRKDWSWMGWRVKHRVIIDEDPMIPMCVLGLHPNVRGVAFLLLRHKVVRYEFGDDKKGREQVGEFPKEVIEELCKGYDYNLHFISAFTLLFPPWPTHIPTLAVEN